MPVVLLVEDNHDNLAIYTIILEHRGYTVLQATDGRAGVEIARRYAPDMILMDISMPVMNGWEAFTLLRSDPATASIPIVALTAHAMESDEQRAVELGFDAFVRKPIAPNDVVELVASIVGPVSGGEP